MGALLISSRTEMARTKIATFAAGCFWGPEARFRRIKGVVDAAVGYTGGQVKNPTYQMVCTDETGHAEVVQVTYDPSVISYEQLLEAFWQMHDPTTPDRQGFDFGSQYRSAIFYHDENQHEAAEASKKRLDESGQLSDPIVTEITAAGPFYRAEEYHQRYLEKTGQEDHC
jgi:peptide-methionine (S)-S-oxide reductase